LIVGWRPTGQADQGCRKLSRAAEARLRANVCLDIKAYSAVIERLDHHGVPWKSALAIDKWPNVIIGGTHGKVFFVNMETAEVRKKETIFSEMLGIHVYRDLIVIFEEAQPAIIVDKDLRLKYTFNQKLLTRY
jgi:hypothetical protein